MTARQTMQVDAVLLLVPLSRSTLDLEPYFSLLYLNDSRVDEISGLYERKCNKLQT